MIVNVSGSAIEDYVKTAEIINELDKIPAIELNISCPCLLYTSYPFFRGKGDISFTNNVENYIFSVSDVYKRQDHLDMPPVI